MKNLLKKQNGAVIIATILVLVLAVVGGGLAFLTVRMVVSGDGNFLQPFEELGWIDQEDEDDSKEDVEDIDDEDKDSKKDDEDKKKDDDKDEKDTKKTSKKSGSSSEYLIDDSRLSSDSKKSGIEHYYGKINLAEELGDEDDEYADLYKLIKAGVNIYAKDGKAVEIAFGFDVSEFCKKAFEEHKEEFETLGMKSADALEEMMMGMIESSFDSFDEEYSEYITKYVDGGVLQLYVTEKGFESLYDEYGIEDKDNDVKILIDALEDALNTKISLVKD